MRYPVHIGASLRSVTILMLVAFATSQKKYRISNQTVVTITKYEGNYCTGAEISSNTFPDGVCLANSSLNATDSFKYHCHNVVRPVCAFLRFNCTRGNIHGRVEEFPCDICSASGIIHPTVFNFTCSSSTQKATFNTNCTDGCGVCERSIDLRPGMCSSDGNAIPFELIKVGPCQQKVMTVSFSERNCSGMPHITGLIASGECDVQRSETRVCHSLWNYNASRFPKCIWRKRSRTWTRPHTGVKIETRMQIPRGTVDVTKVVLV